MPLLNKREYVKKDPWRDATIFIIVCEGSNKEPDYFEFFHLLTEKIKVVAIPSEDGKSSPNHLIPNAEKALEKYNSDDGDFELWFVIDVDKWVKHIHVLQREVSQKKDWNIVISNPCFEVWLNNHFENVIIPKSKPENCKSWKSHVHVGYGGFDHTKHPTYLSRAIANSENSYEEEGYIPNVGSTQVYRLGKRIFELTKVALEKYFPSK